MKDAEKWCFSLIFSTDSKMHNFLSSFFFFKPGCGRRAVYSLKAACPSGLQLWTFHAVINMLLFSPHLFSETGEGRHLTRDVSKPRISWLLGHVKYTHWAPDVLDTAPAKIVPHA